MDLPEELRVEEVAVHPTPRLLVRPPERGYRTTDKLRGELSFDYDGLLVAETRPGAVAFDAERRRLVRRDVAAERAAGARLLQAGFTLLAQYGPDTRRELPPRKLPAVARQLLAEGWRVEAEGKLYRNPGEINVEVESGIDWFDLKGAVDFGDGVVAPLPELLAALRRGEGFVTLGDGTLGVLPEEWLRKYGALAAFGTAEGDRLRFKRS
jgi:hypothetical protein